MKSQQEFELLILIKAVETYDTNHQRIRRGLNSSLNTMVNTILTILTTNDPRKAFKNVGSARVKPTPNWVPIHPVKANNRVFKINVNNPRVRMIKGQVSRDSKGRSKALTRPNINARRIIDSKFFVPVCMPGTIIIAAYRATALINQRSRKRFMLI
jgi:hypothetical protein